jgi:hypothetical protein
MQVFDQQIATARRVCKQLDNLLSRVRIDRAAFRRPAHA